MDPVKAAGLIPGTKDPEDWNWDDWDAPGPVGSKRRKVLSGEVELMAQETTFTPECVSD